MSVQKIYTTSANSLRNLVIDGKLEDVALIDSNQSKRHFGLLAKEFINCSFENLTFYLCRFDKLRFSNCSFKNSKFKACIFDNAILNKCDISGTLFENCTIQNVSFIESRIGGALFLSCNLTNTTGIHGCKTENFVVVSANIGSKCAVFPFVNENILCLNISGEEDETIEEEQYKRMVRRHKVSGIVVTAVAKQQASMENRIPESRQLPQTTQTQVSNRTIGYINSSNYITPDKSAYLAMSNKSFFMGKE